MIATGVAVLRVITDNSSFLLYKQLIVWNE